LTLVFAKACCVAVVSLLHRSVESATLTRQWAYLQTIAKVMIIFSIFLFHGSMELAHQL